MEASRKDGWAWEGRRNKVMHMILVRWLGNLLAFEGALSTGNFSYLLSLCLVAKIYQSNIDLQGFKQL